MISADCCLQNPVIVKRKSDQAGVDIRVVPAIFISEMSPMP